jgi:hypothetical protein
MNWIFEAYANVYQTATGLGRGRGSYAAPANNGTGSGHDGKSPRR